MSNTPISKRVPTTAGEAHTNAGGSTRAATKRHGSEEGTMDAFLLSKHHQDVSSPAVGGHLDGCPALEQRLKEVMIERDAALRDIALAQKQIKMQTASIESLHSQVEGQPSVSDSQLRRQRNEASRELADARLREATREKSEYDAIDRGGCRADTWQAERLVLLQWIDGQQRELQMWKDEAMSKGSRTVSKCWQASVDEGVRREREKDGFVIKQLRDEIEKLKTSKGV